jgi:hypothetical protein
MTEQNTIIPPEELVQRWARKIYDQTSCGYERDEYIARAAAQWGADQELEACCELLTDEWGNGHGDRLHRLRRPKPPSLKEQALVVLDDVGAEIGGAHYNILLRALEAMPDD